MNYNEAITARAVKAIREHGDVPVRYFNIWSFLQGQLTREEVEQARKLGNKWACKVLTKTSVIEREPVDQSSLIGFWKMVNKLAVKDSWGGGCGCPGWGVYDTCRGIEIQRCDECNRFEYDADARVHAATLMTEKKRGVYVHFKGGLYHLEYIGVDTEGSGFLAVYRNKKGTYVRPAEMFFEEITLDSRDMEDTGRTSVPRFSREK